MQISWEPVIGFMRIYPCLEGLALGHVCEKRLRGFSHWVPRYLRSAPVERFERAKFGYEILECTYYNVHKIVHKLGLLNDMFFRYVKRACEWVWVRILYTMAIVWVTIVDPNYGQYYGQFAHRISCSGDV